MAARPPVYAGSASGMTPSVGAEMQRNLFGIDALNRPFTCPRSLVQTSVPAVGTPDIFYPNLRATGYYSITEIEGQMCSVNVEYKGLLNGALPDALISSSLSTGSASATAGDSGAAEDQRTWEVVFYSPSRTFRYVLRSRPPSARYGWYAGLPSITPEVIFQSIKDGTGRNRSGAPGISQAVIGRLSAFNVAPVPGSPLFECEETWQGVIELRT
jgi:hypothetical protein